MSPKQENNEKLIIRYDTEVFYLREQGSGFAYCKICKKDCVAHKQTLIKHAKLWKY